MPQAHTPSLILRTHPYSETSRILRLLTRDHGVQSVIARGALRPKSRFGGVLETFTSGIATFHARENRELHTLSGFELERTRQGLGRDLKRFGGASLIAELVLKTGVEGADPDLFEAVRSGLDRIDSAAPAEVEATVLAEAWTLVSRLGFTPVLDECLQCGRPLGPGEDVSFDHAAGGARCLECASGLNGRPIPAAARAALGRLLAGEAVELERTGAHWQLLARFLTHHVVEHAPLRSLDFLAGTLAIGE